MKTIKYHNHESFAKTFKKLLKKFKTLPEDLETAKRNAIELFHLHTIDNQSIVQIPGVGNDLIRIFKLRKFACKSLKGRGVQSGIRIIYAFDLTNGIITFIEIYFKPDQENEDQEKITAFLQAQVPLNVTPIYSLIRQEIPE